MNFVKVDVIIKGKWLFDTQASYWKPLSRNKQVGM
jgi:hypothetical protein